MNIDERFKKLEKQIKNLKKMLGGVAALALAALIGGTVMGVRAANSHGKFEKITANNIFLKDYNGITRVRIAGVYGTLQLSDRKGRTRASLRGDTGLLSLRDKNGKPRAEVHSVGRVKLWDSKRKVRLVLRGSDGTVKTYKSNGKPLHELGKGSGPSGPHTHTATATTKVTLK